MSKENASKAANTLQAGGVILAPTDTVYGLMALPCHDDARAKIFRLKRRPEHMNLQLLCPTAFDPKDIGAILPSIAAELLRCDDIRSKITFVLPLDLPEKPRWLSDRVEVGIRIPADSSLQEMLLSTGPVFATSANAHGNKPGKTVSAILSQLDGSPDFVWDAGLLSDEASTVINFNNDPPIELRRGAAGDLSKFGVHYE
jgi:L-threonylcarbamoyladenylate synthase